MAGERTTISFKTDPRTEADIEAYRSRAGKDNRSQAVEELVQVGLREQRAPILSRWRDSVAQVALIFTCVAVSTLLIGVALPVATLAQAVPVAAAFAVVALALVASIEVARALNGQSELGERLRRAAQ